MRKLILAVFFLACFGALACNPTPEGMDTEETRGGAEEPPPGLQENPALPQPERPAPPNEP